MSLQPEEQTLEERRGIIVIGMISSGKSTFLNSLLGITYLESKDDVTTKFVTIIRYNENLNEPKFYHLKVIKKENPNENENKNKIISNLFNIDNNQDKENVYYFVKDGEESIGEKNIIERIEEINKAEKGILEPQYETLFYMLETNITNIENKEFLKTHDFYDIPGLNEYIVSNEKKEEKKEEKEENNNTNSRSQQTEETHEDMRYIKGIFQYLKKKIEREIIIFSSETYYKPQNLQIIKEIKKELDLPLYHNLVILNKIDICDDKEKAISNCQQFFVNNIDSNIFNIFKNVFVPLNSMQFKNEILMRNNYENYYLYYLNKYIEKYIRIKEEDAKKIKIIPFIEFLISELTEGKKKEEKNEFINNLANNFDDDNLDIIKNTYEKVKNNSNYIIDYGINFDVDEDEDDDDNQSLTIMKAFYENFSKKENIPEYSESVKIILDYFNKFKDNSSEEDIKPLIGTPLQNNESKAIEILKNIFDKLKKYTTEEDKDNIINILNDNLTMMEKFILNDRKIYIPFIGVSSAGKSTILNCIVGYKLFPEAQDECTTRGIIIEYTNDSDKVELYETQIDSERNYYVFSTKNKVAEGYKDVRDYLKSLNCRYSEDESKHFYIVRTTMKSFDDFGFSDELKKRILLVDLPGSDTKDNKFNKVGKSNRSVYEKLLSISSSFIYINKGRAINETNNQTILKKLYTNIQDSSKLGNNDYLKACLFAINLFSKVTNEELNMENIKKDLSTILFNNKDNYEEINSVFFNAKNFYDYLYYSTLLKDYEAMINQFEESFESDRDSSFLKTESFPKYCLKKLKQKLKDLGIKLEELENCPSEFLKTIEDLISEKITNLNEPKISKNDKKFISQLANIFNWFKDETVFHEMDAYKNSYCKGFLEILKTQIEFSKTYKDEEYIKKLKDILKYFDTFFSKSIKDDENESKTKKQFKEKKKELKQKFEENLKIISSNDLFSEARDQLEVDIKTYKDQAKKMLKAGKNFDDIILIVSQGLEGMLNKLHKNLDGKIELFNQKTQNLVDDIKDMTSLFNQLEFEKNEQYKNNFDQLINSGKDIFIEKTKESGILYSLKKTWSSLWTSVVDFFRSFKGKEIAIIEKIDDLRTETLENLNNKERIINFNFDDEKKKIEQNFNSILALAFSDLSNIEEKEWIESKEQYLKAKKYLLPSEEIELFNDIEKKDEGEEKKEEEKIIEESKKSQEK